MNTRVKIEFYAVILAVLLSATLTYSEEPAATPKINVMEELGKRAAILGVILDSDAILKVITEKESALKQGIEKQTAAFNRLQEINGKANRENVELKELREQGAKLETEYEKRLAEIPAIIELSQKKRALADEQHALRVKRDALFKLHNELKKRKLETGDTSKDDEIAKLVKDLQDTDKRMMQDLPAEMTAAAVELAKCKIETGKTDPDCVRLIAAMDQNSMDTKRKMDSVPGLVDEANAVRTWSDRTNVLRAEIGQLKSLLKELQAEKKNEQAG